MSSQSQRIEEIFHAVLDLSPSERAAYLADACGGNVELQREVESMISSYERAGSFMNKPAIEEDAQVLAGRRDYLTAGELVGAYKVVRLLAAGGMGEVYVAEDTRLGRRVALKLLPSHFTADRDRVGRFQQEARAASALNHPNIVTVHDFVQAEQGHFIVTEYVEGETLRQRLKRSRMDLDEVIDVAIQIGSGLSAAHTVGVVHRDIKPENVMLRPDGLVKVVDFGLVKLTEERVSVDTEAPTKVRVETDAGMVMGTVNYMSPEQARGLKVDARTDIWSLGCVLYEMVAGGAPFAGPTTADVIVSILGRELPPLLRSASDAPAELERIVAKALTKDREERYQTTKNLLSDLRRLKRRLEFEAGLERSAQPPPSGQAEAGAAKGSAIRTGRAETAHPRSSAGYSATWIRKHRRGAAAVLAATILLLVAGIAYYFAHESRAAIDSLAVLPFSNTSADPNTEYISDGITESIVNSLSKVPNLKIISLTSVARYKGQQIDPQAVGREMGVRAVLVGRVAQRADGLLVSVELVDVRDKRHIWGEQYNRRFSDILAVQGEVSKEIAEQLRFKISGEQQGQLTKHYTENPEAYQSYLKGRYYWNKRTDEGFRKALVYFEESIVKDPNYALAYAGLADAYTFGGGLEPPPKETLPKAKAAAMKALELDDTLAEAHGALGWTKLRYDFDWSGAEREFKRAIELNPNYASAHNWYSVELGLMGRFDEAVAEAKRGQELEPLSMIMNAVVGLPYYFCHQYDQAIAEYRRVIEMDPNFAGAHDWLGLAYEQKGMFRDAVTEFLQARTLSGDRPENVSALRKAYLASGWRGYVQKDIEQKTEESKKYYVSSYDIAVDFARLGGKEQGLAWLEKAYEERAGTWTGTFFWFRRDPRLDSLRSEPRFIDLARRAGISPD